MYICMYITTCCMHSDIHAIVHTHLYPNIHSIPLLHPINHAYLYAIVHTVQHTQPFLYCDVHTLRCPARYSDLFLSLFPFSLHFIISSLTHCVVYYLR